TSRLTRKVADRKPRTRTFLDEFRGPAGCCKDVRSPLAGARGTAGRSVRHATPLPSCPLETRGRSRGRLRARNGRAMRLRVQVQGPPRSQRRAGGGSPWVKSNPNSPPEKQQGPRQK